jgi:hypothetical protein
MVGSVDGRGVWIRWLTTHVPSLLLLCKVVCRGHPCTIINCPPAPYITGLLKHAPDYTYTTLNNHQVEWSLRNIKVCIHGRVDYDCPYDYKIVQVGACEANQSARKSEIIHLFAISFVWLQ